MISFLRKIRKNLLETNSFRRYIAYALGEIFLVVLGILIALQINNWSETSKTARNEIIFKQNIIQDLSQDKTNIQEVMAIANEKLELFNILLDNMHTLYEINPPEVDSVFLAAFDPFGTFFPIVGTFKSEITSGNLGKYTDKSFISSLNKLYTNYDRLAANGEDLDQAWGIRYEKYSHERRVKKLGNLTPSQISAIQDDIARCSKLLLYYVGRCELIHNEINELILHFDLK